TRWLFLEEGLEPSDASAASKGAASRSFTSISSFWRFRVGFRRADVDVCARQLGYDVGEHVQVHDRRRVGLLKETLVLGGETVERAAREAALRRRDGDAAEPAMSSCRGVFEGHWRTLLYSQERL